MNGQVKRASKLIVVLMFKRKRGGSACSAYEVATISANGEKEIGDLISKAMEIVGKDGVITIVDGKTLDNELEAVQGMKLSRGPTNIATLILTEDKVKQCVFQ